MAMNRTGANASTSQPSSTRRRRGHSVVSVESIEQRGEIGSQRTSAGQFAACNALERGTVSHDGSSEGSLPVFLSFVRYPREERGRLGRFLEDVPGRWNPTPRTRYAPRLRARRNVSP